MSQELRRFLCLGLALCCTVLAHAQFTDRGPVKSTDVNPNGNSCGSVGYMLEYRTGADEVLTYCCTSTTWSRCGHKTTHGDAGDDTIEPLHMDWTNDHTFDTSADETPITITGPSTEDCFLVQTASSVAGFRISAAGECRINDADSGAWLIVRASAGAFTPSDIPSLEAWYDFSDAATVNYTDTGSYDEINTVTDKSGNGHTISGANSQTTTSPPGSWTVEKPRWTAIAGIGGGTLKVAFCDGDLNPDAHDENTQFDVDVPFSVTGSFTLVALTTVITWQSQAVLMGEAPAWGTLVDLLPTWKRRGTITAPPGGPPYDQTESLHWTMNSHGSVEDIGDAVAGAALVKTPFTQFSTSEWYIHSIVSTSSTADSRTVSVANFNGTDKTASTPITINETGVGTFDIDNVMGTHGGYAEFLLFDAALDASTLALVENYLADKWSFVAGTYQDDELDADDPMLASGVPAIVVENDAGTDTFKVTGDGSITTAGVVNMEDSGYVSTLDTATLTADRSITTPDNDGEICLDTGSGCGSADTYMLCGANAVSSFSGTTTYMRDGNLLQSATVGWPVLRAGSVTGVTWQDTNAGDGADTTSYDVRVNGSVVFSASYAVPVSSARRTGGASQAAGVDALVLGDFVSLSLTTGSSTTSSNPVMCVEVTYD